MTSLVSRVISEDSLSLIDSVNSIKKSVLCPRSNDVNCISEEVLNTLDRQVTTYLRVHSVYCKAQERHFPFEFKVICDTFFRFKRLFGHYPLACFVAEHAWNIEEAYMDEFSYDLYGDTKSSSYIYSHDNTCMRESQ